VAPQDSQICGRNFQKRKKSAAELCQILRMVTVEIVINTTGVMGVRVTISCRYALSSRDDAFVSSWKYCLLHVQLIAEGHWMFRQAKWQ